MHQLAAQGLSELQGLRQLRFGAARPGKVGTFSGRAYADDIERRRESQVPGVNLQTLGDSGVSIGESALQQGQLRRCDEQRRSEPRLLDRTQIGLSGLRKTLSGQLGTASADIQPAAGRADGHPDGSEFRGYPVGCTTQQHVRFVPVPQREPRTPGGRGQERAVPPPEPVVGRLFRAL